MSIIIIAVTIVIVSIILATIAYPHYKKFMEEINTMKVGEGHPDAKAGEVILCVATPELFKSIGWKTKRQGRILNWENYQQAREEPYSIVFVAEEELLQHHRTVVREPYTETLRGWI